MVLNTVISPIAYSDQPQSRGFEWVRLFLLALIIGTQEIMVTGKRPVFIKFSYAHIQRTCKTFGNKVIRRIVCIRR